MNDQFHLFQDENSQGTAFRSGVQPNYQHDTLVGPKGAASARKALGNITNNNGGLSTGIKQGQNSENFQGRELLNIRKDVRLSDSQTGSVSLNAPFTRKESQRESRLDDLVRGGIESSAGPTWDQQEALKDLALGGSGLSFDVTGHQKMLRRQIEKICSDLMERDGLETKRTDRIGDNRGEGEAASKNISCIDAPPSPNGNTREESTTLLNDLDVYFDEDLANVLP